MARYFFNVSDGTNMPDEEGTELPSLLEAHQSALRYAGLMISERSKFLKFDEDWLMKVLDENGLVLFRFDFIMSATAATMMQISRQHAGSRPLDSAT